MKTQKERADDKRKEKLEQMQEQLDAGTLKVSKMTAKERAANPPRERPERGRPPALGSETTKPPLSRGLPQDVYGLNG